MSLKKVILVLFLVLNVNLHYSYPNTVPGAPRNLTLKLGCDVRKACIKISWLPPLDPKLREHTSRTARIQLTPEEYGKIYSNLAYHIRYRTLLYEPLSDLVSNASYYGEWSYNTVRDLEFSTNSAEHLIGAEYEVKIAAENDVGKGPEVTAHINLPEGAPSDSPRGIKISGTLENVTIEWAAPNQNFQNGRIIAYDVRIYQIGREDATEKIYTVTYQHSFSLLNLGPGIYHLYIRARTRAGAGMWTDRLELPIPIVPYTLSAPQLYAVLIDENTVELSWKPRTDNLVSKYRIWWSVQETADKNAWQKMDVSGALSQYILYADSLFFRISVVNGLEKDGQWSEVVTARKSSLNNPSSNDFEDDPISLKCSQGKNSSNIYVIFNEPINQENIIEYHLEYEGIRIYLNAKGVRKSVYMGRKTHKISKVQTPGIPGEDTIQFLVQDLAPNTEYKFKVTPIYEISDKPPFTSKTTCKTGLAPPEYVHKPIPVEESYQNFESNELGGQMDLKLERSSGENGPIHLYYLIVAPETSLNTHYSDRPMPASNFEPSQLIRYSEMSSDQAPYLAMYSEVSMLFTIINEDTTIFSLGVEQNGQNNPKTALFDFPLIAQLDYNGIRTYVVRNKRLIPGIKYRAALGACSETLDGKQLCNASEWSKSFDISNNLDYMSDDFPRKLDKKIYPNEGNSLKLNSAIIVGIAGGFVFFLLIIAIVFFVMKRKRTHKRIIRSSIMDCTNEDNQDLMWMLKGGTVNPMTYQPDTLLVNAPSSPTTYPLLNSTYSGNHPLSYSQSYYLGKSATGNMEAINPVVYSPSLGRNNCLQDTFMNSPNSDINSLGGRSSGNLNRNGYSDLMILTKQNRPYPPCYSSQAGLGLTASDSGTGLNCVPGGSTSGHGTFEDEMGSNQSPALKNNISTRRYLPISIYTLADYIYEGHQIVADPFTGLNSSSNDAKTAFQIEYESLEDEKYLEINRPFITEHATLEVNLCKNRYPTLLAYDHSRVVLQHTDDLPSGLKSTSVSNYINASFLDSYKKQNAIVATQGPLENTMGDFWLMVWEQRAPIIVALCRTIENGRVKTAEYWPSKGTIRYDNIYVTLIESNDLANYNVRFFQLQHQNSNDKHEVWQFQYTSWPDIGVPKTPSTFLEMYWTVQNILLKVKSSGPMVVHCSGGVGRTGVWITLQNCIERLKVDNMVDVFGMVNSMRRQRNYMVQTSEQYAFIYDCLWECYIHPSNGQTQVSLKNLYEHTEQLSIIRDSPMKFSFGIYSDPLGSGGLTGFELEFRRLKMFDPMNQLNATFTAYHLEKSPTFSGQSILAKLCCIACNSENQMKNRLANIVPFDWNRVKLNAIRGEPGSDYINASFIDGYRTKNAYIVTQGPLQNTIEDFWRMVWQYNSCIIVSLCRIKEDDKERCAQYWPKDRPIRYQFFLIDPLAEYTMTNFILREFKMTDTRDGQSRTVRQFQFISWPHDQSIPSKNGIFMDLITQVHKTKEQFGHEGPITVHCGLGAGRSGVFVTVSMLLERIRQESTVDVFQTVKLLRQQRIHLIQTEDQYRACHLIALDYINSFDLCGSNL